MDTRFEYPDDGKKLNSDGKELDFMEKMAAKLDPQKKNDAQKKNLVQKNLGSQKNLTATHRV